jgi:hypothetical protein
MNNAENYSLTQGAALAVTVTLTDALGATITTYTGTEALTTAVWPGADRAAAFAAATAWIGAGAGTIQWSITDAQSAGLAPGRYQLLTRLQDPIYGWVDVYTATLDIAASAGSAAAPSTYTTLDDLLRFGRSWLRQLQTDDDQAGFAEQQHRARTWIEDLAHAHFRVAAMTMVIGSQAFGPRRSGARSVWLQQQLDANYLMLTDQIREAAAKKALAYICEGQVGLGEQAGQYARLARLYHGQADYLGSCLTLSLDTNGDGFPDVNIDCSSTDPMYG